MKKILLSIVVCGLAGGYAAAVCLSAPPTVSVTCKNAAGDETIINKAIDTMAAMGGGGDVIVNPGTCLIEAVRTFVVMKSFVNLRLAPDTILSVIPNSSGNSNTTSTFAVLARNITNAGIYGGQIIGDRVGHVGGPGEWGFGIGLQGAANFIISGTRISNCWGDGIIVSGGGPHEEDPPSKNITVMNVVSNNNRRQGLSGIHWVGGQIINSTFSNTNGTLPQSGIDMEPSLPTQRVTNVSISGSTFSGNAGSGIILQAQSGDVSNVIVDGNTVTSNAITGVGMAYSKNNTIINNMITLTGLQGIELGDGCCGIPSWGPTDGNTISGNTIANSGRAKAAMNILLSGTASRNKFVNNTVITSMSPATYSGIWIGLLSDVGNTLTGTTCVGTYQTTCIHDGGTGTVIN